MKRITQILAGGMLAVMTGAPAHAEKSDRIIVENMRARVAAARAEIGLEAAGAVELSEADARLRELYKALDNNEEADARASINGIDALIAAARVRAQAVSRTPQVAPARWVPGPMAKPTPTIRKRIGYTPRPRAKRSCIIASR